MLIPNGENTPLKKTDIKGQKGIELGTKHNDDLRQVFDTLTASDISNSGAWLPTPEHDYRPKLFDDPRNPDSRKENMPPLKSALMAIFNVEERNFLDKTEKLVGTDSNLEAHVAQQIPLPRTRSPGPNTNDKQPGLQEQLEIFTEDDMDIRDFSEGPKIDMRPQKPPRKTKAYILDLILQTRMPRLYANEPCSYLHSQASTARNQKFTCREEEGTNRMACLPEEITSQGSI